MNYYSIIFIIALFLSSNLLFSQATEENKEEESPFFKKSANYEERLKQRNKNYEIKEQTPMYIRREKKADIPSSNKDKDVNIYKRKSVVISQPNEVSNHKPASDSLPSSTTLPK